MGTPEARDWLNKALALAPSRKDLRSALIGHLVAERNHPEAIRQYELLAKDDPLNPDLLRAWGELILKDASKPEAERREDRTGALVREAEPIEEVPHRELVRHEPVVFAEVMTEGRREPSLEVHVMSPVRGGLHELERDDTGPVPGEKVRELVALCVTSDAPAAEPGQRRGFAFLRSACHLVRKQYRIPDSGKDRHVCVRVRILGAAELA